MAASTKKMNQLNFKFSMTEIASKDSWKQLLQQFPLDVILQALH